MKKALITGIDGQIGSYLAELLLEKGYEVHGLIRRSATLTRKNIDHLNGNSNLKLHYGDLSDYSSLAELIKTLQPDEIYNTAAQSHVGISFQIPEYTGDINAIGVTRLLEIVRQYSPKSRVLQYSTSELYGGDYNEKVTETTPFYPKSPYSVAKLYAYWICKMYRETYGLFISNVIMFNTESPRRGENFITRKVTKGVTDIIKGKISHIELGNLDAVRTWGHSKDSVRAHWLILQHHEADDFLICNDEYHTVRELCEVAFKKVGIAIKWQGEGLNERGIDANSGADLVVINPRYIRPNEVEVLKGDYSKANKLLGWKPTISFNDLITEMIEYDLKNN